MGIYNLQSVLKSKLSIFNPEETLALTDNFSVGAIADASINRLQDVVFACDIVWPSTFNANGLLFEAGGTGIGSGVGLINSGSTLRVMAGDGGTDPGNVVNTATLDIPTSTLVAGQIGTLVWDYRINPGRARAWFNGTLLGEASTSAGGPLEGNAWSGGAAGYYGGVTSSGVPAGLVNAAWTGTIISTLRYYNNQLV